MLRNIDDALVSRYLYNKAGRECWLTTFGEPMTEQQVQTWYWPWKSAIRQSQSNYP